MDKLMSIKDAIDLIKDGDTIWINAFSALASPVELNKALTQRYREKQTPRHLTVCSSFSFGDWNDESDIEGYIVEGAVDKVMLGYYGSMKRTCKAIMENKIEGYNLPGGVMSHMIRASARGASTIFSKIGLNLFVDPRIGQYKLNERSKDELVHLAAEKCEIGLLYDIPKVDVAFLKASYADARGNISFQNECASVDALSVAQATHRTGGKVIVQVARVTKTQMLPSMLNVPAALVDAIVVCAHQGQLTTVDGSYDYVCGKYVPKDSILVACRDQIEQEIGAVTVRNSLHRAIARRAFRELKTNQIVNIGIGIPELVAEEVLNHGLLDDIHLSVESGHTGGFPLGGKAFGAAIGPDTMLDMARQFDFYEGGGLDAAFIGALEVDGDGNVNGHYTQGKLSGIGGFANITQTTRKVVFCLNFTARGLEGTFDGSEVHITREGKIKKFVEHVSAVSFSVVNSHQINQEILYVTERCVFRLGRAGLVLCEVAPGVDMQRDILDLLPFDVEISPELRPMEF